MMVRRLGLSRAGTPWVQRPPPINGSALLPEAPTLAYSFSPKHREPPHRGAYLLSELLSFPSTMQNPKGHIP